MEPIAAWIPLVVGAAIIVVTIAVHGLALIVNLRFIRHERAAGHLGAGWWIDLPIVITSVTIALLAHLLEIGLWAALFV
jgi:hypothetical protein